MDLSLNELKGIMLSIVWQFGIETKPNQAKHTHTHTHRGQVGGNRPVTRLHHFIVITLTPPVGNCHKARHNHAENLKRERETDREKDRQRDRQTETVTARSTQQHPGIPIIHKLYCISCTMFHSMTILKCIKKHTPLFQPKPFKSGLQSLLTTVHAWYGLYIIAHI